MDPLVWETKPGKTGWTEDRQWVCDSPKGFRYIIFPAEAFGPPPHGYRASYASAKTDEDGVLLDKEGGTIFESVLLAKEAAIRFEEGHEPIQIERSSSPRFDTLHIERYDSGGYRLTINPEEPHKIKHVVANNLDELMDWIGRLAEDSTDEKEAIESEAAYAAAYSEASPAMAGSPIIQNLITQLDEQKSRIESLEQTSGARTAKMQGYTREHYELSTRLKKVEENLNSLDAMATRGAEYRKQIEKRLTDLETWRHA